MNQHAKVDIRHSTCPHDCPSACALDIEVIDGSTIGRVRGSKLQPYTAGVVCAKVARYAERVHHPDRLIYPQFRVGRRDRASLGGSHGTTRWTRSRRGSIRPSASSAPTGVALLLRRHHGSGDEKRHQSPYPSEEIFPLLRHDLFHHAGSVCRRHRQGRRRRSARNGRLRPGRDLGHQSGKYPGQRDDARRPRPQGTRRQDRGDRYLQQRHHEAGRYQDHPAARHRRRFRLRRHACAVPRRLCRSRLSRALYRLSR